MESDEDGDGIIINNIVQFLVLFYNSENEFKVKIYRQYLYDDDEFSVYLDELKLEDLSDNEKEYVDKFYVVFFLKINQFINVG